MRRRRPEEESKEYEFLDEDDQTKLIDELQAQSQKQQSEIQFMFLILCVAASVASFFVTAWVDRRDHHDTSWTLSPPRVLRWIHAVMAIGMFYVSFRVLTAVSKLSMTTYAPVFLYVLLTAFALFGARTFYKDETVFLHQGLALANILVFGGALFLRWDEHSMKQSFKELKESQYRFKSL